MSESSFVPRLLAIVFGCPDFIIEIPLLGRFKDYFLETQSLPHYSVCLVFLLLRYGLVSNTPVLFTGDPNYGLPRKAVFSVKLIQVKAVDKKTKN